MTPELKKSIFENNFNLIRLFAIMKVVFFNHYFWYFDLGKKVYLLEAFHGVPIFFLITGIFIPMSFESNNKDESKLNKNIITYTKLRVLRIIPEMWLSIVLSVLLMFASSYVLNTSLFDFIKWFFIYLFYPLYTPDFLRGYGVSTINGSLWTVPVQISFYILIPILYKFFDFKNRSSKFVLSLIFIFAILQFSIYSIFPKIGISPDSNFYKVFSSSLIFHYPMLFIGIFVYKNFEFFYNFTKGKFLYFLLIHLGQFVLFDNYKIPSEYICVSYFCYTILPMITVTFCVLSAAYTLPKLSSKILGKNDISYQLYVYHVPIANYILYTYGGGWTSCLISFSLVVVVSILSKKYIGTQLLKYKHIIKSRA